MATTMNNGDAREDRDGLEGKSSLPNDLPDNERDAKELKSEITYIDMPDVKDIPGQEFVHPAPFGELADTTIASADEEGDEIFADAEEDTDVVGSAGENRRMADKREPKVNSYLATTDDDNLRDAAMDNSDFEGEPLNEKSFGDERSGRDLDARGDA